MLRLTLGVGGSTSKLSPEGDPSVELRGVSGTYSIDIGGAIAEDLVLHGRLAETTIVDPSVKVGARKLGELDDLRAAAYLMGPAVTYYFMPANVYFTAAVGLSWLVLRTDDDDDLAETDVGLGLNLDAGKEFWVSDNWGLGVAVRLWSSVIREQGTRTDGDVSFVGAALLFSATYQ